MKQLINKFFNFINLHPDDNQKWLLISLMMPSLNVALFICGLCYIIDDFGWIIVYNKNKQILKTINS